MDGNLGPTFCQSCNLSAQLSLHPMIVIKIISDFWFDYYHDYGVHLHCGVIPSVEHPGESPQWRFSWEFKLYKLYFPTDLLFEIELELLKGRGLCCCVLPLLLWVRWDKLPWRVSQSKSTYLLFNCCLAVVFLRNCGSETSETVWACFSMLTSITDR